MKFSKFLFFYTLLIVFSAAVSYILSYLLYPQKILVENYWLIFGFMAIVTLIVYYLSDLGLKKGGENQTSDNRNCHWRVTWAVTADRGIAKGQRNKA